MAKRTRIVVLGAGFGGVTTIRHLLRSSFVREHCEIILVDQSTAHTFTPWLYEVASGNIASHACTSHTLRESAAMPLEHLWGRDRDFVQFRHAKITGCDVEHRHVILEGGRTLGFDVLLVGLGSQTAYFGIPGLQKHAYAFKNISDANAINCHLSRLVHSIVRGERTSAHVVVGGAGPAGVELAAELSTMLRRVQPVLGFPSDAVRITVITAATRVLDATPSGVSHAAAKRLAQLGVEVLLDTAITRAQAESITVQPRPRHAGEVGFSLSRFTRPTEIAHDMLVWCGGVVPNDAVRALPLPKDAKGRVQVGPTFEVMGHVNIFALGDSACMVGTTSPLPATAHAAEASSKIVAENIIRAVQRRALRRFPVRRWPIIVMVGAKWGIASLGRLIFTGRIAYWLRRGADLGYLIRLMDWSRAFRLWRERVKMYANND